MLMISVFNETVRYLAPMILHSGPWNSSGKGYYITKEFVIRGTSICK